MQRIGRIKASSPTIAYAFNVPDDTVKRFNYGIVIRILADSVAFNAMKLYCKREQLTWFPNGPRIPLVGKHSKHSLCIDYVIQGDELALWRLTTGDGSHFMAQWQYAMSNLRVTPFASGDGDDTSLASKRATIQRANVKQAIATTPLVGNELAHRIRTMEREKQAKLDAIDAKWDRLMSH